MKYLNAGDGGDLFLQKVHPGSEFLSNEVATAAGLQLGDQAFIGQPKLLSVICSSHSRDGALEKHLVTFRDKRTKHHPEHTSGLPSPSIVPNPQLNNGS